MERSYDEKVILYFYRKSRASAFLLFVLGFGIGSVGFNREDSHLFFIIGILFGLMGVWLLIRQRFLKIKGEEVDRSVTRYVDGVALEKRALRELDLDKSDVEGLKKITLQGYCPIGINTEPIFRWDNDDHMARASNFQATYFILDEKIMFTYSFVKSLVDSEYYESGRIWRLVSITSASIEKVSKLCMTAPEKEEDKVEAEFNMLMITNENHEHFGFAFDEKYMEDAEMIVEYINERSKKTNGMRKPKVKKSLTEEEISNLTKKERKEIEIGLIGDSMGEI